MQGAPDRRISEAMDEQQGQMLEAARRRHRDDGSPRAVRERRVLDALAAQQRADRISENENSD